jgi:hypothetical protein
VRRRLRRESLPGVLINPLRSRAASRPSAKSLRVHLRSLVLRRKAPSQDALPASWVTRLASTRRNAVESESTGR